MTVEEGMKIVTDDFFEMVVRSLEPDYTVSHRRKRFVKHCLQFYSTSYQYISFP
jgi:hypothetical protein